MFKPSKFEGCRYPNLRVVDSKIKNIIRLFRANSQRKFKALKKKTNITET